MRRHREIVADKELEGPPDKTVEQAGDAAGATPRLTPPPA
jgi:hypothetical protein